MTLTLVAPSNIDVTDRSKAVLLILYSVFAYFGVCLDNNYSGLDLLGESCSFG